MAAVSIAEQRGDLRRLGFDLVTVAPVHHSEQVVRPVGQQARTMVAVAHELKRADLRTELTEFLIRHIPHGHTVGLIAERVMVRYGADAPDDAALQHALHPRHHLRGRHAKAFGQGVVRPRHQWQATLGLDDQTPVGGIQRGRRFDGQSACDFHASNLRPT